MDHLYAGPSAYKWYKMDHLYAGPSAYKWYKMDHLYADQVGFVDCKWRYMAILAIQCLEVGYGNKWLRAW